MIAGVDYDRTFGAILDYEALGRFVLRSMSTTTLVDLACGTGSLLAAVERLNAAVSLVGVDSSESQLQVARAKVAHARFVGVDMLDVLSYRDVCLGEFDCHLGFAFLNTVGLAWRRTLLSRLLHLSAARTLIMEVWNNDDQERRFKPGFWYERSVGGALLRSRFTYVDRGENAIRIEFEFHFEHRVHATASTMYRFSSSALADLAGEVGWVVEGIEDASYRGSGVGSHDVVRLRRGIVNH